MYNSSLSHTPEQTDNRLICHECDYVVRLPPLKNRQKALCPRCSYKLTAHRTDAIDRIIAFSLAALIFLCASFPFEFLSFSASGQQSSITILGSIATLVQHDYLLLAVLQAIAILLLPGVILFGLLYLLIPWKLGYSVTKAPQILKLVLNLIPWSMAEIFLVGVLVSLVKMMSLADVGMGFSFYAYVGFTLCMSAALLYIDKHQLETIFSSPKDTQAARTADNKAHVQHTWALLVTALVLYIPANLLPIMHTSLLGNDEPSTILGGVILLWHHGSYPIAIIIFIASVFVPIVKLVLLCWLNYSVQIGLNKKHKERIFWYRITELIGRWSMVDVFVVAILVSLIQLGNTMSIYPGPAVLAFCGVVISTMLAAITFDSKSIWKGDKN